MENNQKTITFVCFLGGSSGLAAEELSGYLRDQKINNIKVQSVGIQNATVSDLEILAGSDVIISMFEDLPDKYWLIFDQCAPDKEVYTMPYLYQRVLGNFETKALAVYDYVIKTIETMHNENVLV